LPVKGFYCAVGNDSDLIEKKWIPDLEKRYPNHLWLRYDASIDNINFSGLAAEYSSETLFNAGVCIIIRNADKQQQEIAEFLVDISKNPIPGNAIILVQETCNRTTRLGKVVSELFRCEEFQKAELKPFDLLDALNFKKLNKILQFSNLLFSADYNALALFSLLVNYFIFLRQLKEVENFGPDAIAARLSQHRFRVQKTLPACRFWSKEDLDSALAKLADLDRDLRSWQYDERMLLEMFLISVCI